MFLLQGTVGNEGEKGEKGEPGLSVRTSLYITHPHV